MIRTPHRLVLFGLALLAIVALVVLAVVLGRTETTRAPEVVEPDPTAAVAAAHVDPQALRKLRPVRPGGKAWYSDWTDRDPDPWVTWVSPGKHAVDPDTGVMTLGGDAVRMYVLDPRERQQWTGAVEVSVYARRIPGAGGGDPWSGIVTDVRTNHGSANDLQRNLCDSRGLTARLRFDGYADFGKEVRHPKTVSRGRKLIWRDGMPAGVWIGYKHVVYDTRAGVVQELWIDRPGGGEHWNRINRIVDRGEEWGRGQRPCAPGIDPAMELRGGTHRAGSESGLPNVAVLFRVDDLKPSGGLQYRQASVREVR